MSSPTSTLVPDPDAEEATIAFKAASYNTRAARLPEPHVEKIRGPKLILIWALALVGAWLLVAGVGYGLYIVGRFLFG